MSIKVKVLGGIDFHVNKAANGGIIDAGIN
jgi:hypothetical protein